MIPPLCILAFHKGTILSSLVELHQYKYHVCWEQDKVWLRGSNYVSLGWLVSRLTAHQHAVPQPEYWYHHYSRWFECKWGKICKNCREKDVWTVYWELHYMELRSIIWILIQYTFTSFLLYNITLFSKYNKESTIEINECSEDVKVNWQHYAQYKFGAKYHYMHCYCHDFTNLEIIFAGTPQYSMFTTCTDQYRAFRTVSELQETSQYIYSPLLQTWQVLHLAMKFVQPL